MPESDFKRRHCGWPVRITKLPVDQKSQRQYLQFECTYCGYAEEELRAGTGALLSWKCTSVGARHESSQARSA